MAVELKTQFDLSGLNKFNAQLLGALIGTNQGGEGDAQRFLRAETGQLAWEISRQLGPKTIAQGTKAIERDARKVFFPLAIPMSQVFTGTQKGQGEIRWLFGSSSRDYLVGADADDVQLELNSTALAAIRRRERRDRGAIWRDIGSRKMNRFNISDRKQAHQHVIKIERTVVRKSSFNAYIRALKEKVGLMRASFAYTAALFVPSKPIPAWVKKHFTTRAQGRAVLSYQLQGDVPNITFGSRAKGVASNPYIADKIARAIEKRKYILADKLKKIVRGYKYNWETGQVFRPQVPKEGLE